MGKQELDKILADHLLWLKDEGGKRADLQRAYLQRAYLQGTNLQRTNLQGTDLQGANLDYSSGIPFHCRGTMAVIDDRLFAQMVYHLTRQDNDHLSDENKEWLKSIPNDILNSFCKYRDDLKEI